MQSAGLLPAFARVYKDPACLLACLPISRSLAPSSLGGSPKEPCQAAWQRQMQLHCMLFGSPRQGLTGNLERIAIALDLSTNGACPDLSGFSSPSAVGLRKMPGYQSAPGIHPQILKVFKIWRYPPGMPNPARRMIQVEIPKYPAEWAGRHGG